jgi:ABC-type Fe3+/spermidine/putrescine transport system ATPase subunit/ABC-type sulfate transport system permease component
LATEAAAPVPAAGGVRSRAPAPLTWLAALLALYLAAPLVAGIHQAWLADWQSVEAAALARACAVSLASASVATTIIALGGVPLGWLLARRPGRGMAALGFLVQLPLALPPLTSGILLLFLVGYSQPLGRLAQGALTDSFAGIVLAQVFVAAPFLVIAARSAFAAIDPVLEGVAATLGRGPLYTFFRVGLPIAWPGISSGLLLAWLRAFGEFGATVMVAYHPFSLPVYTYVAFGAQGLPAMLPILLPTLVLAAVVIGLNDALGRRRRDRGAMASTPAPVSDRFVTIATIGRSATPGGADEAGLTLDLTKRLGDFRLRLKWAAASRRLAILGPSGSGKSLTLQLIAGTEPVDEAAIVVAGRDIAALPPSRRGIGYVPQSYGLFPHLSVARQLSFPGGADPGRARYWLDRLALAGLERRLPSALSLGQQQRVALARALVRPARLLLFDEPFSALDAPMRRQLRAELFDLQSEFSAIFLIVTHDPDEAALLADELLVLEHGRVLQSGPTAEVFRRPTSETVARLLGAETIASGVAVGEHRIAIGGGVVIEVAGPPLRIGRRIGWSVPPGGIRIGDDGRYPGCVEGIAKGGFGCRIALAVGDARIDIFETYSDRGCGAPCRLDIDPYAVRVWPRD